MQETVKKNIDLEKIMKKAVILYSIVYETRWFKERKGLFSEDEDLIKKWDEIKKSNTLVEVSGFFNIPRKGTIPLTIYQSGFIVGPDDISQKELEAILEYLLE